MRTTLRSVLPIFASIAIAVLSAEQVHASIAYEITNTTGETLAGAPYVLGFEFTVNGTISVDQLGLFDDSGNGFANNHSIGIFSQAGSLLASATVTSGLSNPLNSGFRYVSLISPLLLSSAGGTYSIGAVYEADDADKLVFTSTPATGFSVNPSITFVGASYAAGNSLVDPSTSAGGNGYFGPNFQFSVPSPSGTPEPASLAIWGLGGLGLAVAGRMRRRKV